MRRVAAFGAALILALPLGGCAYQAGAPGEIKRDSATDPYRDPPTIRGDASLSPFRRRLVGVLDAEWRHWGSQHRQRAANRPTERSRGYSDRVLAYWREGVGRSVSSSRVGWSGAFVTWALKRAGAGDRWPASGSHAHYIAWATKNRANPAAAFAAYRLSEYAPRVGDIVCNSLERGIDYDRQPARNYASHCDIVVEVRRGEIDVIGGNLSDAVRKRTLVTDSYGRLIDPQPRHVDPAVRKWFAVIQTRL
jgi:hypothetical protein